MTIEIGKYKFEVTADLTANGVRLPGVDCTEKRNRYRVTVEDPQFSRSRETFDFYDTHARYILGTTQLDEIGMRAALDYFLNNY
jgi:hypothetical protein